MKSILALILFYSFTVLSCEHYLIRYNTKKLDDIKNCKSFSMASLYVNKAAKKFKHPLSTLKISVDEQAYRFKNVRLAGKLVISGVGQKLNEGPLEILKADHLEGRFDIVESLVDFPITVRYRKKSLLIEKDKHTPLRLVIPKKGYLTNYKKDGSKGESVGYTFKPISLKKGIKYIFYLSAYSNLLQDNPKLAMAKLSLLRVNKNAADGFDRSLNLKTYFSTRPDKIQIDRDGKLLLNIKAYDKKLAHNIVMQVIPLDKMTFLQVHYRGEVHITYLNEPLDQYNMIELFIPNNNLIPATEKKFSKADRFLFGETYIEDLNLDFRVDKLDLELAKKFKNSSFPNKVKASIGKSFSNVQEPLLDGGEFKYE